MNIHICMSGLSPHTQQMRSRRQTSTQHLWVSYTSPGCGKMLQVKEPTASWPHAEHRRSFADHHLHVVGVYCHQVAMLKIFGTTGLRAILVSAVVGFFQPAGEDPSQNITRSTYAYHHNHPATCCWFFKDCKQACLHRHSHNPSLCQAKYQCKHTQMW